MSFNKKMASVTGDVFVISNGTKDESVSFESLLVELATSTLCPSFEIFGEDKPRNWQPLVVNNTNKDWINGQYFSGRFVGKSHSFNVLIKPNSANIQVLKNAIEESHNGYDYQSLAFEMLSEHIKVKHNGTNILVSKDVWSSIQNGRHHDMNLENCVFLGERFSQQTKTFFKNTLAY